MTGRRPYLDTIAENTATAGRSPDRRRCPPHLRLACRKTSVRTTRIVPYNVQMVTSGIDFDGELERGLESYDDVLGQWWLCQSQNAAHRRAYRTIARYLHDSFRRPLELVIDYGCGTGTLLSKLVWRYPEAHFMGVDGSAFMLDLARQRIAHLGRIYTRRIQLLRSPLPNFALPRNAADLIVYAFPNIVPRTPGDDFRSEAHRLTDAERHILRRLAGLHPANSGYADMLRDRLIALNLRSLLRRGGYCVRIEYGAARRDDLPQSEMVRIGMEEGSLDCAVGGRRPRQWFRVVASTRFRSGVIDDVGHQAGIRHTGPGGYVITVLRAL